MVETRTCPICKRPLHDSEDALRFRPFCSKRCADIDLGRWLKGSYAIPATEVDDEDGEAGEASHERATRHRLSDTEGAENGAQGQN